MRIPISKPGAVDMSKSNGQADVRVEEQRQKADLEHELPPADPGDGFEEKQAGAAGETPAGPALRASEEGEAKKLREERDVLFDRLARLQAEFDNYRKRVARENIDF